MSKTIPLDFARLAHWYWSPAFPTTYKTASGAGVGRLAFTYPAAFNLMWAKHGAALERASSESDRLREHMEAVTYLSTVNSRLNIRYNSWELETYITLMTRAEFEKFYSYHVRKTLPNEHMQLIDQAIYAKV